MKNAPPNARTHEGEAKLKLGRHIIVGGTGFLGRSVARRLLKNGNEVLIVARAPAGDSVLMDGARVVHACSEEVKWDSILEPHDVIHYYAWNSVPGTANGDPAEDMRTNVAPLIRLLEAMRKIGPTCRIIFTSSGGTVYGNPKDIPVPESHPLSPITAYGAGKAAAELYLNFYRQLYGLDCRIARLANPYGPGQNIAKGQGAISIFLDRIFQKEPIKIWGDGETVRDYIFIDDAVNGLLAVAETECTPSNWTFNIGSGHGTSLNILIAHLQELVDWQLEVDYLPGRGFDVPISVLDISRARTELDWQPHVGLSVGLKRTFDVIAIQKIDSAIKNRLDDSSTVRKKIKLPPVA
ncbi:NAD-dependent epimerase/dehydratase family protein [Variovorax paradoxus]|uniref:NAD-dependent epimerase/dehydratase family protein n=1 Tax=Variovorax paradoxus TaxID=34073 RepID=UPI003ECD40B6